MPPGTWGKDEQEEMVLSISKGARMEIPDGTPVGLVQLITDCWHPV